MQKRIVVLSGAGMSAESGLQTFRDNNGLWNNYRVEEVATPEAWLHNMPLVIEFYNQRRKQLFECEPNAAHYALAALEDKYDVRIITQNVDDLHERAGSTHVLHLHGELRKIRSSIDPDYVIEMEGWELKQGDKCPRGSQMRPHIVWFGEPVPNIHIAAEMATSADILIVVGTSLQVYPAAGLVHFAPVESPKYYIDPAAANNSMLSNLTVIRDKAGIALPKLAEDLLNA
jgi:NAD-dependent deacetylase